MRPQEILRTLSDLTDSPIAAEALRRIADLYVVECSIGYRNAGQPWHVCNASLQTLLDAMKSWLETELARTQAVALLLKRSRTEKPLLCRFLDSIG